MQRSGWRAARCSRASSREEPRMLGATEPACVASEIRFWKSLADCPHDARISEIASVIATPAPTCAGFRATGGVGGAGADAGASSDCSLVPPNTPVMKRTTRERSSRPIATPPYPTSIEYGSGATATSGNADGTPNHSSATATAVTTSIAVPTPAIHVATRDGGNDLSPAGTTDAAAAKRSRRGTRIASQTAATSTMSAIPSPMRSYGSVEYVKVSVAAELWAALRW